MLYPDLARARLGYVVADVAALLWVAAWLYAGDLVYHAVMTLSVIARPCPGRRQSEPLL